ncbi:DUF930 domain-containing protein [Devosia sp.]|jgi:hypothetical protein|uniref:DUF930 domain-containing protein n=1 Tax=Devosia sp. TaxID=1871048 RepID=UPI0037C0AE97
MADAMSDMTLSELKLIDPPGRERWLVWTALASLLLHAGVLVITLGSPLREAIDATPPQAIEVELVKPAEEPPEETPPTETPAEKEPGSPAAAAAPAAPEAAEPAAPAATPQSAQSAPDAVTSVEPPPAATQARTEASPTPMPRPASRTVEQGTEGGAGPSSEPVAALKAETGEAEGDVPGALSTNPGVADLDLGEVRTAEQFYLEAMLQQPSLARARDMLQTLPAGKRLSQTCNIEALAQIGNSGAGFVPDVVMTDAYALSTLTDTRLSATGAIFRSQDKWYGLAFDCTLSDDLTQVTAFSYQLGADVTEAVLARMGQN